MQADRVDVQPLPLFSAGKSLQLWQYSVFIFLRSTSSSDKTGLPRALVANLLFLNWFASLLVHI